MVNLYRSIYEVYRTKDGEYRRSWIGCPVNRSIKSCRNLIGFYYNAEINELKPKRLKSFKKELEVLTVFVPEKQLFTGHNEPILGFEVWAYSGVSLYRPHDYTLPLLAKE